MNEYMLVNLQHCTSPLLKAEPRGSAVSLPAIQPNTVFTLTDRQSTGCDKCLGVVSFLEQQTPRSIGLVKGYATSYTVVV